MRLARVCLTLSVALPAGLPSSADAAPPEVLVSRPVEREIADEEHFTGRTEASTTIEIRSRVTSYLEKVLFKDGAELKKGDLLFQLDDRPYRAELEKAQAVVAREEAKLTLADADFTRGKKLRESGAISAQELNKLTAALEEARAALQVARAALELAKLDLDYTRIAAPISGEIGRSLFAAGNVVSKDSALATIVVVDPLHVYFDVDERTLLRLRRLLGDSAAKDRKAVVQVRTAANDDSPRQAVIDFSDNRIDPATGTLRVRAVLPNPKADLLPGMFVTVKVPLTAPRKVLLIPSGAIARQDGKDYILVVNDKNILEAKMVQVGSLVGGLKVIEQGVAPSDLVIVTKPRDVKAGDEVKHREAKTPLGPPLSAKPQAGGTGLRAPLPDLPVSGPTVVVTARYPGANAQTVKEVVAGPIEKQLDGLDNLLHQFSVCTDAGEMRLTLVFKKGTDLNIATVLAANRVRIAEVALPEEVRRVGVTIKKGSAFLLAVSLVSPDSSRDRNELGKMAQKLREELIRVPAIADATFYGEPAPEGRLHLEFDRDKLAALRLTMADLRGSVEDLIEQAGQDAEKLAAAVLKTDAQGRVFRVRDVARVVHVEGFGTVTTLDGKPCATLLIYQTTDANARDTAKAVRERLKHFDRTLAKGIESRVIE
jgi:RND family efflux transporter MFP subunit